MNFRITTSILPVIVFYALTRVGPPWLSISGGFAVAAGVFWYNRRQRLISWLTVFGFGVVTVTAVVGIIWSSEKAYLAAGPIQDFLFVPLYLGSILAGKPLIGGIAREMVPAVARRIPQDAGVFVWTSALWAVYDLCHGVARVVMLQQMSVGEYLVWSRVLSWPFGAAVFGITAWAILRESRRVARANGEPPPSLGILGRGAGDAVGAPVAVERE